jgi:hypothetical protein
VSSNAARLKEVGPRGAAMTAVAAFNVAALFAILCYQNSVEKRK